MDSLRIRRADASPGVRDGAELFAKAPESAIADGELSDEAVRLLLAIDLDIVKNGGRVSLATNQQLARACGRTAKNPLSNDRWVSRWLRALRDRGQIETAPVTSIAGGPRGIRPLARLKGRGATTKVSWVDPTKTSGDHDADVDAPRQDNRRDPTIPSVPFIRSKEQEEQAEQKQTSGVAADVVAQSSSSTGEGIEEETGGRPGPADFLGQLAAGLARHMTPVARKSPARRTGKSSDGAQSRDSVPDA